MTIYKLEFTLKFNHDSLMEIKNIIKSSIKKIKKSFGIDIKQKFHLWGRDYSFQATFTSSVLKDSQDERKDSANLISDILNIFKKNSIVTNYCITEEHITEDQIEIEHNMNHK